MIREAHFSGRASGRHEFSAAVVGAHVDPRLVYDGSGSFDRFFCAGSEIRVTAEGVHFAGTGGAFCAYLFGVEIPDEDLLRKEVRNRLVMHGTRYDDATDRLVFSADTSGFEPYARLFDEGHAFANYFFFVAGDLPRPIPAAQEALLRATGRFLKRVDLGADRLDCSRIARALHDECGAPAWTTCVVRVVDSRAAQYFERYAAFALGRAGAGLEPFDLLATEYGIDPYRRERIHLDVAYRSPRARPFVDAYKAAVAARIAGDDDERGLTSRLHLLRAKADEAGVPLAIFDRLDAVATTKLGPVEPLCVLEGRHAIGSLFSRSPAEPLDRQLVVALLRAKRAAAESRYSDFERVLLGAADHAESWRAAGAGARGRAHFEAVVGYLDLFETTWSAVAAVAFRDDGVTALRAEELLEARAAFDELEPGLFDELFLVTFDANPYLDRFGRRRLDALGRGLRAAAEDPANGAALIAELEALGRAATLHRAVVEIVRDELGGEPEPHGEALAALARTVESRLRSERGLDAALTGRDVDAALLSLEEERFYASELLPSIVETRDTAMRGSFLRSSGLDPMRVGQLETEFLERRRATI